jgi:hypothetical protein
MHGVAGRERTTRYSWGGSPVCVGWQVVSLEHACRHLQVMDSRACSCWSHTMVLATCATAMESQ